MNRSMVLPTFLSNKKSTFTLSTKSFVVGMLFFTLGATASAAITTNTSSSLLSPGQTIKASSVPTAVIGLNLVSSSETFNGLNLSVNATAGFDPATDFATLGTATSSGIALYKDNKSAGIAGLFDDADTVVTLSGAPTFTGATTTLTFATPETVPTDDTGANTGSDYFVVIRTAAGAVNNHAVSFNLYPGQVTYSANTPAATPTALTTSVITVDTVVPTVMNTGPSNGASGVPIGTFINVGFSENMDFSTLSSSNIVLTTGGSPVGASINSFPMGFSMVVSSPPSFAASTSFAKVATTTSAFFMINSGQTIYPQGSYSTPATGDIVYFQRDTFPAEFGIVTNSTLTGGSFFVNDFPMMGGQNIIKFRSAGQTGLVSAATVLKKGDLVMANTFSNPTGNRYAWHVVTTGAAVNNAALRLDNESSAPVFNNGTTTTFSTISPNATTTVNGSNQLQATTTLAVGDLVFAKVTANADNLNAYAWHVVTAAEIVATGTAPTALRLDSSSSAPVFATASVIAVLIPSANGAVTDTTTNLGLGEMIFAKTTAGAANNGSYAFHMVSSGNNNTGGVASTDLRLDNSSANLLTGTAYTLTIGTGIKDKAGNPLASASITTFNTGSTGNTNSTPPFVQSSLPAPGNQSFAPNAPLKVTFSVDMAISGAGDVTNSANVGLYASSYGSLGSQVSTTNTYDSSSKTVTLAHSALTINTEYILIVKNTTKSATDIPVSNEYRAYFKTASATDSSAPTIMGSYPQNGATAISRSIIINAGASEDLNPSTVSSSTVTLVKTSGATPVEGTPVYNPQSRSVSFSPTTQLLGNTEYTFTIVSGGSGVKDMANNALATNYVASFTTDNATDSAAPGVSFSNADNFGVAITFSEPLKQGGGPNAVDNIANYTIESPVGSSISLGGKTVMYDGGTRTARISGLSLQNGNAFKVSVSNQAQDLAGNGMDTTGTPAKNTAFGTVADSSMTGGQLGPGTGPTNDPNKQGMNPIRVSPMVRMAGSVSSYHVEFLASSTIPLNGQIVLTFPTGFNVGGATAVTAGTQSFCNSDLNGPMSGTVTMGTLVKDASAGTITIPVAGAASGANAFICLDIAGIINSTIPSSSGYTVDIKTKDTAANNLSLLETKTSAPFFLGETGSNVLTVHVFHDDVAVNDIKDGGEEIANAKVFLFSPATGGQATTTNASGVATFNGLSNGDYQIGLQASGLGSYAFNGAPQMITLSGSITKKFILSAAARTISGTVYGPSSTNVDVFAASPNGFAKTAITTNSTATTSNGVNYGGSATYSLGVQNNTTYQLGVGPSMPDEAMIPGSTAMAPPTFTFMPPQPTSVNVVTTNIAGQNFNLTSATNSIAGTVKDSSNAAVSNAGVFCRPVQNNSTGGASGFGTGGQTGTDGSFTIRTVPGVYLCGAFKPGMPSVPDKQVTIAGDGTQTPSTLAFTLGAAASSLTITGTIKDDSGNAVPYAGVGARKVTSTSDTSALGGGTSNFVGGPADSNGAYTLYVSSGTWVVDAFAPGVGRLGTKTITVGSSNVTGQDFSAQTMNLGTITGMATQAGTGVQGVMVRAETSDGTQGNMTPAAADGTYSLKVPAGTYAIKCFFPGIGESAPLTSITVTNNTTTANHDCSIASPITITVNVTDGTNPIANAFVDVRSSNGRGNGTNASKIDGVNAVYTVQVPPGTYSVRVGHQAYGQIGSEQTATTTGSLAFSPTSGALFTATGQVTADGSALSGGWVSFTGTPAGQTNMINAGAQTSATGTYSVSVPAGTYKVRANKPGYKTPAEITVVVSASTTVSTIALTTASRTISGTVTLSGNPVPGAFVDANDGAGGFAVSQTDANGAYSLAVDNGTWAVRGHSQGYEAGPTSVVVLNNSPTQTLTLTAISGFTVKPEKQENITPTAGGMLTNTDIGNSFKLNIPANALGTSANAGTVKTQVNTAMPTPSSGTILSKSAVTISAFDSTGLPIKNLNDNVTIVVPYSEGDIPTGQTEANLVLGVWNDATQVYDTLPTTVDTTNNTLTAVVSHFSDFAPLLSSNTTNGTVVVATPAPSSSGGGGGYYISTPTTTTTVATSSVSTLPTSTSKVTTTAISISPYTRTFNMGSEGKDVEALQTFLETKGFLTMPKGVAKGYFGTATKKALAKYQTSVGLPPVGLFGPATKAKVEGEITIKVAVMPSQFTYDRALAFGSSGSDVSTLQTFLENKGFLIMPKGMAKGYFGAMTKKALAKYQTSVGIPAVGLFGPMTRAHFNSMKSQ